jgi:hypothetical protein
MLLAQKGQGMEAREDWRGEAGGELWTMLALPWMREGERSDCGRGLHQRTAMPLASGQINFVDWALCSSMRYPLQNTADNKLDFER